MHSSYDISQRWVVFKCTLGPVSYVRKNKNTDLRICVYGEGPYTTQPPRIRCAYVIPVSEFFHAHTHNTHTRHPIAIFMCGRAVCVCVCLLVLNGAAAPAMRSIWLDVLYMPPPTHLPPGTFLNPLEVSYPLPTQRRNATPSPFPSIHPHSKHTHTHTTSTCWKYHVFQTHPGCSVSR